MPNRGKVSGKLVVFLLFGGALLLWGIVLLTGYREKLSQGGLLRGGSSGIDTVVTPDSVRFGLARLPGEWIKVTRIEGQGWVFFVPCYSSNSRIHLKALPDSQPALACDYCDSLDHYAVRGIARDPRDSATHLVLDPPSGDVRVLPVSDSLLARFPEAPFRDHLLLWIRPQGPDSTGAPGAPDTLIFVPKALENDFEVLRAEDENPEGCGGDPME